MTVNGLIAVVNGAAGLALIFLGLALLWRANGRIWRWPVSAYVALAGPYLVPGLVLCQIAVFRAGSLPPPFTANGWGTLGLRVVCAVVVVALVQRVVRGRLLTAADRARLETG